MQQTQVVIGKKGGIPNVGNTCYLNSVLQIIAKLYPHTFENKSDALARAGQKIVNKIKYDQEDATREETRRFYQKFLALAAKKLGFELESMAQADAQEAFMLFFQRYIFDSAWHIKKTKNYDEYQKDVKKNVHVNKVYRDTTIDNNPLFGTVVRFDPISGPFQMSCEPNTSKALMKELLSEAYFRLERIKEYIWYQTELITDENQLFLRKKKLKKDYESHPDYKVDTNDRKTKVNVVGSAEVENKLGNLRKLPNNVLPVMFKRSAFDQSTGVYHKLHTTIQQPFELNIEANYTVEGEGLRYELVGFILHLYGSTKSGHFVAYIKNNGVWKQYDDSRVTLDTDLSPKEKVEDVAGKAYFYFYKRVS